MGCSSFFTVLVALIALLSFCIKLASSLPPPQSPASCSSLFSHNSSWLSGKASSSNVIPIVDEDDDHTRNRTLFIHQSSLSLLKDDQSLSFTFTATTTHSSLAFILVRSPQRDASPSFVQSMELLFTCDKEQLAALQVCKTELPPLRRQRLPQCSCENDLDHSNETEVSLNYTSTTQLIRVQAVDYRDGLKINQTFTLRINDLLPHESVSNESTTLFVGYITSDNGKSHEFESQQDNGKSSHKKVVVVWVIVGVCVIVFFIGVIVLVLFMAKRRGRPSLGSSCPARHGAPPPAPSRAPFSHHDLESSATPMMRPLPLSPPYPDAFQIYGAPSWLKQPNPR